MKNNKILSFKLESVVGLLVVLLMAGSILFILFLERFTLYDDIKLLNYRPSTQISRLASLDTMTNYARTIFYINNPQLLSQSLFAKQCPNVDVKQMAVLGCYHGNEGGIYLLSVTDPKLYGLEQVTAAHEMLHGIYSRLSTSARNNLDVMLENYYLHGLTNPRIKQEIALYKKTEPGAVFNEMNSTFGTECPVLPADLNAYYKQFFTNRQVVVSFDERYQGVLSSRQTLITNYDNQLKTLNSQITKLENTVTTEKYNLNKLYINLQQMQTTNSYSYNQQVPGYNQQVYVINNQIRQLQSLINQYNQIVIVRNKVANQLDGLEKQITGNYQVVN